MILFAGHAGMPTGFARVLDSIAAHLPYEVARVPIDASLETVVALRPGLVLVLDEPWRCAQWAQRVGRVAPTLFYPAVDGPSSVTPAIAGQLARADGVVAFQAFGRAVLEDQFARIGLRPRRIETIPHGVDSATFHPLDKRAARRAVFGADDDAFVVLNANRNQPFKRVDLTVEGFALFARDKGDAVRLCLHMGTRTPHPGEVPLADRFGIRDRIVFTEKSGQHPQASDARLNQIYNACDVGINTSEKEGWGLIAFEHGATRAAQVVPRHSACAEWEGAAYLLEPADEDAMERYQKAGRTVTVEGIAAALETLYRNREERERLADAAFARATDPRYAWSAIAARWDALFRDLTRT